MLMKQVKRITLAESKERGNKQTILFIFRDRRQFGWMEYMSWWSAFECGTHLMANGWLQNSLIVSVTVVDLRTVASNTHLKPKTHKETDRRWKSSNQQPTFLPSRIPAFVGVLNIIVYRFMTVNTVGVFVFDLLLVLVSVVEAGRQTAWFIDPFVKSQIASLCVRSWQLNWLGRLKKRKQKQKQSDEVRK